MKCIYKKISLEQFRCRIPNTLVSFSKGNYLIPQTYNFFTEYPNGNYGACPSDIILPLTFVGKDRTYDFTTVTDVLSTSINLIKSRPTSLLDYPNISDYSDENLYYVPNGIEYYKTKTKKYEVSTDGGTTWNRYMSYRKLRKWFTFFKDYFRLLSNTTCKSSDKSYKSAVEYYYSDNIKSEDETLSYFEKLDEIFISRGGKIDDDGTTHCDLYDWMQDYIFLDYNIETATTELPDGTVLPLKQFAKEWKTTQLNIVALMHWYKWFGERFSHYSGVTDCKLMDYDDSEITDCCDCEEYLRLGGDGMYYFLKKCVDDYEDKIEIMRSYCTNTATMNIELGITVGDNNVGEGSILAEDWEGGVNYYPLRPEGNLGTTVHYGGTNFHREENNEAITVQDSIFIADKRYRTTEDEEGYLKVDSHSETKYGYLYNKYKELGFITTGTSIYQEYLPKYIKQYQEEFMAKDNASMKSYAYSDNDFVKNPTIENMCTDYDIVTPSGNTHFFYIDDKIYQSEFHKTLMNSDGIEVSGTVNPILIQYTKEDGKSLPYVEYKGNKYFGYYFRELGTYRFTFKKIPRHTYDWYDISPEETEFVMYDDVLYAVEDGYINVVFNSTGYKSSDDSYESGYTMSIEEVDGYIADSKVDDTALVLVKKINGTYYCVRNVLNIDGVFEATPTSATQFCNIIKNTSSWQNDSRGYWITSSDNALTLHFIKPYTEYDFGYVRGSVKSRLDELQDFTKTHDRLGNEMGGLYCGKNIIPTDNELLDMYYHVGNTSDLTYITQERGASPIYKCSPMVYSSDIDFYWGNVITGIEFYFKDNDGDILQDSIVKVDTIYQSRPSSDYKQISNLDYIEKCLKRYIKTHYRECELSELGTLDNVNVNDIIYCETTDDYELVKVTSLNQMNDVDTQTYYSKVGEYKELINLKEKMDALDEKMYCKISYSIGGIVQKPWAQEQGTYIYAIPTVTDDFHHGVEYQEEYIVGTDTCTYYADTIQYFNVNYIKLEPTEVITYYMDDNPDEFSDEFSANTAYFKMETNPNMTKYIPSVKYTTGINTSLSDGRQFSFYNGLMACPTIVENYNIGITSLRNVDDDIYVDRGVNYAYDKHLKLLEIKSLEALEEYGNGFFNITDNNND